MTERDQIPLRLLDVFGRPRQCDCCGREPSSMHYVLGLNLCDECNLPSGQRVSEAEYKAWHAVVLMAAGARKMKEALGQPVSVWFLERYERLGLKR